MTLSRPPGPTSYDEAEPVALETSASPCLSQSKPNGVPPAEANAAGVLTLPSPSTAYVSIELELFSVTTSVLQCGENEPSAGADAPTPSGSREPAIGARPWSYVEKPPMLPAPPA